MLAQHKAPPYNNVAVKRTRLSPDSNVELTILKILSEKSYPFILHLKDVYEDPTNYYFVTGKPTNFSSLICNVIYYRKNYRFIRLYISLAF